MKKSDLIPNFIFPSRLLTSIFPGFLFAVMFLQFLPEVHSQNEGYYDDSYLRFEDHVYRDSLETVQLFRLGWEDGFPILKLNSSDQLMLSFEDLNAHPNNFSYHFIHCNADWQPSDLKQMEYLRGMDEYYVEDYDYSGNTRERFVRYRIRFPQPGLEFLKSGNYIIRVYDRDTDETVITRRFMIFEDLVNISLEPKRATEARYRETHHEVDFTIHEKGYELVNPYTNMKTVVMQNRRWDNAKTDLEPRFIRGGQLIFDFQEETLFPGNNEFRFLDIRNLNYHAQNTASIERIRGRNHVFLTPDEPRSSKVYLDQPDINGQYLVRNDDRRLRDILDADYAWVHFTLPYPAPLKDGNIHIFGQLTDWRTNNENAMKYNEEKRQYEGKLYLKQGYYDYVYAYQKDGQTPADISFIEGNHAQAENYYSVLVYHRPNGAIYDRLVGFQNTTFPNR